VTISTKTNEKPMGSDTVLYKTNGVRLE